MDQLQINHQHHIRAIEMDLGDQNTNATFQTIRSDITYIYIDILLSYY